MFKICIAFAAFALLSCEEKEAASDKAVDSYESLIEKAKETEAVLQKKADSIARLQDSLGISR